MGLLTTSKLIAVSGKFASDARTLKLLGMLDAIQRDETASKQYEKSCKSKNYQKVRESMISSLEGANKYKQISFSREIDTLMPGELMLQQNSNYYLIKGFTSSVGQSPYHIRFENPGEQEITNFHLTTEEGWSQVRVADGLQAKGHFYFKVDDGFIEPMLKNQIVGSGIDQASDMRMASLVQDTMIYVYYIMYRLKTI